MITWYKTKNGFQSISRKVRINASVKIKFSNDPITFRKKNKTHQFKSKLLLLSTNSDFPYCHTYSKANAVFKKLMNKIVWIKRSRWGGLFFFFINQNLCHILFLLFLFLQALHWKRDVCDKNNDCLAVLNTMT